MRTVVVVLLLLSATLTSGQQESSIGSTTSLLEEMSSPKWRERNKAFQETTKALSSGRLSSRDADRLRLGAIQLLATENTDKVPAASEKESEASSEYYSSLIDFVAHMGDERAIPALLGAAMTGGIATRGVARFGNKALQPTLAQARSADPKLATGAVYVLQKMLEMHTVNGADSNLRIMNALRTALSSRDAGVRQAAVYAVEYLDEREALVPMLKDLAEHDPDKLTGQPRWDGTVGDVYPVRELARRLLRKIANHEPPNIDRGVSD
jgi:HEAT repeat protein